MKKNKFMALVLVFALVFATLWPTAEAAAAGTAEQASDSAQEPGADIHNPENGKWSYIYFGSYPQTEVAGDDLTDAIKNASYNASGDATVNGVKYRRIYTKQLCCRHSGKWNGSVFLLQMGADPLEGSAEDK